LFQLKFSPTPLSEILRVCCIARQPLLTQPINDSCSNLLPKGKQNQYSAFEQTCNESIAVVTDNGTHALPDCKIEKSIANSADYEYSEMRPDNNEYKNLKFILTAWMRLSFKNLLNTCSCHSDADHLPQRAGFRLQYPLS
jgi:hypothetical protein